MRTVRVLVSVLTLAVLFCMALSPAFAWEFQLKGVMNWKQEWYNQRGHRGFFGPYDVDNGTGTRIANLNFWNGGEFDTNLTTSADAGWSYFTVDLEPTFKLNDAIRLKSKYRLGAWNDQLNSKYLTQNVPGASNAFSEGQWTLFWATAQTPWGALGIGKRSWNFGLGLQYDADCITSESILISAPYGPFDLGIAFLPYRFVGTSSNPQVALFYGNPYDLHFLEPAIPGLPPVPFQYFSRADRSGTFSKDFLAFVTYSQGPLFAGILGCYGSYHIGPEAVLVPDLADPAQRLFSTNSELFHGSTFVKYNSGRFFLNAEAAWVYWSDRHSSVALVGPPRIRDTEQWRYAAEAGVLAGPAKLAFLYGWAPGPDRRRGNFFKTQAAAFVWHAGFDQYLGNHSLFRPYSYLFAYDYGSGLNAYNLPRNGFVRDAQVLATRLDYAMASNLNIYASFAWLERTAHGYSWGCIGPNAQGGNFPGATNGLVDFNFNRYPESPNIPDRSLGYEIDTGFDWQLLDGWTVGIVLGYWQPGRWFSYACIDRSVPGWQAGTPANLFGTRPGRAIDPIIGGEFAIKFEF